MAGGFVFCEYDQIPQLRTVDGRPLFQAAMQDLESEIIPKAESLWKKPFARFKASSGEIGRTTILSSLFDNYLGVAMNTTWRQNLRLTGQQMVISGNGTGFTLPEDFMVAWAGLAFPNKEMNITELKWQIGDSKYGRVNIEEMRGYNSPALLFEKGFIIEEEQSFELNAYVEEVGYQYIIMLGFLLWKNKDRVLGNTGAAIT